MRVFIIVLGLICVTTAGSVPTKPKNSPPVTKIIKIVIAIKEGKNCEHKAVPRQPRIVGGEPIAIENYPFMAGMLEERKGAFYLSCGGTLISPTSVVSAAHCFEVAIPPSVRVRLGTDKNNSGGTEHIVSRIIIHPEYGADFLIHDILIMRLRDPAVYSDKINRARIAGPLYDLPANTVVYAVGWGDIRVGGPRAEILQHVAVNVIDHQICRERYANLETLPEIAHRSVLPHEMFCTGILDVGGKDACQGDSGGPVIHNRDVLVGITSWGNECAHPFYPGVNVRVSSYTDWIYTNSVN